MRREVPFVLTVVTFLKCFAEAWAAWFLGPALNSHSSALGGESETLQTLPFKVTMYLGLARTV